MPGITDLIPADLFVQVNLHIKPRSLPVSGGVF
jgi:hypothetical protein